MIKKKGDALGDRMKAYENVNRRVLPRRSYTIIRVDGRAFHSYTRHLDKPFDGLFQQAMVRSAEALCEQIQGAVFAYTQSDEISILVQDFEFFQTQPWLGGVEAKIISLSAALATAEFNYIRTEQGYNDSTATFDARVFQLPYKTEVANYFIWRQRDAVRNSIFSTARAHFSHKDLQGLDTGQLQEKLWTERGIGWEDTPTRFKRGALIDRITHKVSGDAPGTWEERGTWDAYPAPNFAADSPDSFLMNLIPDRPE